MCKEVLLLKYINYIVYFMCSQDNSSSLTGPSKPKEEKKYEKRAEEIYEGKKNQRRITKSKKKYSFFFYK